MAINIRKLQYQINKFVQVKRTLIYARNAEEFMEKNN